MTTPNDTAALVAGQALKIADLRNRIEALQKTANFVAPFTGIDYLPEMHRVSLRTVVLDSSIREVKKGQYTNYVGTDTYFDPKFCEPDERALSKTGILKLFRAAGIDVVFSARIDDRRDPLYGEWRVEVVVPELDGRRTRMNQTKIVDLRPGSPQREAMTDAQARQAVRVFLEVAETKALLRAARAALQLRQKYTVQELAKPFVIPILVPDLDTSDPEIRRMVAAKAIGLERELYGPKAGSTVEVDGGRVDTETGEVVELPDDEGDDAATANAAAAAPVEEIPAAPPARACECPCGCSAPLTEEAYTFTRSRRKAARCPACWPASSFDYDRHKHLASLGLSPDMSPRQAAAAAGGGK